MDGIRIGTLVEGADALRLLPQLLPHGFESFSLTFPGTANALHLQGLSESIMDVLGGSNAAISSLSIYGNPLTDSNVLANWKQAIDCARLFGCDLVTGFTGRIPGRPIHDSIRAFQKTFRELAKRAANQGVRLAFENSSLGGTWREGDWNIAHGPIVWEMMFHALPYDHVGLEWEPSHQVSNLIDPLAQLRKWAGKIFHIHGKDAAISWDIINKYGINSPMQFAWPRMPGLGDSNWSDIIAIVRQGGFKGSIDIEGEYDHIFTGEFDLSAQVQAMDYLRLCREGDSRMELHHQSNVS